MLQCFSEVALVKALFHVEGLLTNHQTVFFKNDLLVFFNHYLLKYKVLLINHLLLGASPIVCSIFGLISGVEISSLTLKNPDSFFEISRFPPLEELLPFSSESLLALPPVRCYGVSKSS